MRTHNKTCIRTHNRSFKCIRIYNKQSNNKMAAGITFTDQIYPNHAMYEDDMDDGMVGNGLTLAGNGIFNIGNSKLRAI